MNIDNIKKLFQAYFIENGRRDLIWIFGVTAIIILCMNLLSPYGNGTADIFIVLINLCIFPERFFHYLSNPSKSIHYLMVPANSREKVTVGIILLNVYIVIGLLISLFIGYSLSYLILNLSGAENLPAFMSRYAFGSDIVFWIIAMFTALSVFFFGAIYLRKKSTIKTLGIGLLINFALSMIVMLVLFLNVRFATGAGLRSISYNLASNDLSENSAKGLFCIVNIMMIVFFYALSFLRLKETEA